MAGWGYIPLFVGGLLLFIWGSAISSRGLPRQTASPVPSFLLMAAGGVASIYGMRGLGRYYLGLWALLLWLVCWLAALYAGRVLRRRLRARRSG